MNACLRFALMIATSTLVMFGLKYHGQGGLTRNS